MLQSTFTVYWLWEWCVSLMKCMVQMSSLQQTSRLHRHTVLISSISPFVGVISSPVRWLVVERWGLKVGDPLPPPRVWYLSLGLRVHPIPYLPWNCKSLSSQRQKVYTFRRPISLNQTFEKPRNGKRKASFFTPITKLRNTALLEKLISYPHIYHQNF